MRSLPINQNCKKFTRNLDANVQMHWWLCLVSAQNQQIGTWQIFSEYQCIHCYRLCLQTSLLYIEENQEWKRPFKSWILWLVKWIQIYAWTLNTHENIYHSILILWQLNVYKHKKIIIWYFRTIRFFPFWILYLRAHLGLW